MRRCESTPRGWVLWSAPAETRWSPALWLPVRQVPLLQVPMAQTAPRRARWHAAVALEYPPSSKPSLPPIVHEFTGGIEQAIQFSLAPRQAVQNPNILSRVHNFACELEQPLQLVRRLAFGIEFLRRLPGGRCLGIGAALTDVDGAHVQFEQVLDGTVRVGDAARSGGRVHTIEEHECRRAARKPEHIVDFGQRLDLENRC